MEPENQTVQKTFISFITSVKKSIRTDIDDLQRELKKRNLIRVPFYLFIGISVGLLSTIPPQESVLRQTGTGMFTASTIFSLHEIIHSRIHQAADEIAQYVGDFEENRNYRPHIISASIVLMDILVALPMFAYREYSRVYTEWVTACLFMFSYFLIVSWLFRNRINTPSTVQESPEYDVRADYWNQRGMISLVSPSLFVGFALLILLPIIAFSPIGWDFGINFFFFFIFPIIPFVFVDIFHYISMSVLLYAENIDTAMRALGRLMNTYAGLTFVSGSIMWILLFREFCHNLVDDFNSTPSSLVIILMGVSWTIIGIMGILPHIMSTYQVLKTKVQN